MKPQIQYHYLLIGGAALVLTCCADFSTTSSSATADLQSSAQAFGVKITSVIRDNDISGVETIEAWKVDAEAIAASGDPEFRADYVRLKGLVDLWVNRKKLEVTAAARSTASRKADLSARAVSPQLRQTAEKLTSTGTKSGGLALFGIAKALNRLIVAGKTGQAEVVNQQLDELRLANWGS